MKPRILLNLALAVLVAALSLAIVFKPKPAARNEFRLPTLAVADATRIAIEKPEQAGIVLQKTTAGWRLSAPFSARADTETVARMLEILDATSTQRFEATDLARFQLDKPLLRLTLNDREFSFGTQNPLTGEIYVATGNHVYLVAPRYLAHALKTPADFTARAFLAEQEKLAGFEFAGLKLSRRDDGKWTASPPLPNLGQDDFNRWADEWRHASSLITQPHDSTAAQESFTLRLDDGRLIPCKILRRKPELVILREDEKLQYHFPAEIGNRLLNLR